MLKKKCLYCGTEFIDSTKNHNKLYCSISCRRSYLRRNNENYKINERRYMRKWRKQNPKKALVYDEKRKDSIEVQARYLCYKDRKKRPELYPNECCICGATENIEYHHPDYNFPLSVYPLCKKHHLELHNNDKLEV